MFLFNDSQSAFNTLWHVEKSSGKSTFNTIRDYLKNRKRIPITKILADCLMPNHYHLLFEETENGGISRFMHKLGTGYTMYFNKKYERSGALFAGKFKAVLIKTQEQLDYILAYINVLNPAQLIEFNSKEKGVRNIKRILNFVREYSWSTHKEYLDIRKSIIIDKKGPGEIFNNSEKYLEYISDILEGRKVEVFDKLLFDQ
jgi:putative transposase